MVNVLLALVSWKEVVAYRLNSAGEQVAAFDRSIAPWDYLATTGQEPQVLKAILFAMLGIILVIGIEKTAAYLKTKS